MRRLALLLGVLCLAMVSTACSACPIVTPAGAAPVRPSQVYTPVCSGGNYDRPAGDEVYTPSDCNPFDDLAAQLGQVVPPWESIGDHLAGTCPTEPQVSFTPLAAAPPCDCCAPPAAAPVCAPPAAAPVCAPPAVAAAAPSPCGPPPAHAKPGEVWCCVWVQPPAAAPVAVCTCPEKCYEEPVPGVYETVMDCVQVAPPRTEWQQVPCGDQNCWSLVEIPAQFEQRPRTVVKVPPSTRKIVVPAQFAMQASAPPPGYWEWQMNTSCQAPVVPQTSPCVPPGMPPAAAPPPPPADAGVAPEGTPDGGHGN
jgi:hypothetical protein